MFLFWHDDLNDGIVCRGYMYIGRYQYLYFSSFVGLRVCFHVVWDFVVVFCFCFFKFWFVFVFVFCFEVSESPRLFLLYRGIVVKRTRLVTPRIVF